MARANVNRLRFQTDTLPGARRGGGPGTAEEGKFPSGITSESPMKTPFRAPKIDREWRMTLILAGVVALLCVAVAVVVALRYF
jgi:hypothetical protein